MRIGWFHTENFKLMALTCLNPKWFKIQRIHVNIHTSRLQRIAFSLIKVLFYHQIKIINGFGFKLASNLQAIMPILYNGKQKIGSCTPLLQRFQATVWNHPWSVYINVNSLYFEPFGNLNLLFQHLKLLRTSPEETKAINTFSWTFHVHQQGV